MKIFIAVQIYFLWGWIYFSSTVTFSHDTFFKTIIKSNEINKGVHKLISKIRVLQINKIQLEIQKCSFVNTNIYLGKDLLEFQIDQFVGQKLIVITTEALSCLIGKQFKFLLLWEAFQSMQKCYLYNKPEAAHISKPYKLMLFFIVRYSKK